ncbi:MAG: glycosyltransferase [Gemmatimonadota bacterium]
MSGAVLLLAGAGAAVWIGVLLLPWRPWSCREAVEPLRPGRPGESSEGGGLTVVIPARNEVGLIGRTVRAVAAQGRRLRVIVVDDRSSDGTADAARRAGAAAGPELEVVTGEPLPPGWTGKVWALEQGVRRVRTPLTLLLDADILLEPGLLSALMRIRERERAALVSVMASPRMHGFWEKLLMPAFVHYFKLLYPFALSNDPRSRVAAAAGGCVLLETRLFREIGGLTAIRGRIIDDCALAARVKERLRGEGERDGRLARTWIGLSHGVRSQRAHGSLSGIWSMVARTAFAQLHYSPLFLGLCTVALLVTHGGPLIGAAAAVGLPPLDGLGRIETIGWLTGLGVVTMVAGYLPILRFYRRSPLWALLLPAVGILFLFMTWSSAARHRWGTGSRWKGRSYGVRPPGRSPGLATPGSRE